MRIQRTTSIPSHLLHASQESGITSAKLQRCRTTHDSVTFGVMSSVRRYLDAQKANECREKLGAILRAIKLSDDTSSFCRPTEHHLVALALWSNLICACFAADFIRNGPPMLNQRRDWRNWYALYGRVVPSWYRQVRMGSCFRFFHLISHLLKCYSVLYTSSLRFSLRILSFMESFWRFIYGYLMRRNNMLRRLNHFWSFIFKK